MGSKHSVFSSKKYLIALILASAVILYTASVGYKQINRMKNSADMVARTFEVERTIMELYTYYTTVESGQLKLALKNNSSLIKTTRLDQIDSTLVKLNKLTADNFSQVPRVNILERLRDSLHIILKDYRSTVTTVDSTVGFSIKRLDKISDIVNEVQLVTNKMLLEEKKLLLLRQDKYASQTFLTPLLSLLVAIFSLGIFILAFLRIYKHKEEVKNINKTITEKNQKLLETETFLKGIYQSSNNIISHFIPVFNATKEIIDFKFQYTSHAIEEVTGDTQDDIIGKSLLETYPEVAKNGLFPLMKKCYFTGETQGHDSSYTFENQEKFIHNAIVKSGLGITNTAWDTTKIKDSERVLHELNEKLNLQNTIFKDAESVSDIGSYVWYLDDGTATISDNFYRILGHEPDSFDVTYDNYREFVHPDDLELYDKLGVETVKEGNSSINDYRIISKDGKTKHIHLNGRHLIKEGRPVSLGVVQDISKRVERDNELVESNERLKRSNAELESFNRVASHDLQEPLRKIQMFISRIMDREGDSFSEKSSQYFNKVLNAAERMQMLIQNLLTYSRIERHQKDFEKLDLNIILEKVKEELSGRFKETGAVITSEKLPKIAGVSFEMEQVFTNLIGNSLKYKNENEIPKIKIQAEKVNQNQIPERFTKTEKYYHKISIIDNGIGFDPEYADKIFEVFQRLHQKTEYSGTGIGLSICKKIVENHKGHIHAVGNLGKGAAFIIYLPVL